MNAPSSVRPAHVSQRRDLDHLLRSMYRCNSSMLEQGVQGVVQAVAGTEKSFSCRSPGRKPNASPASTAGRVRMMRPTSSLRSAASALDMARNVLPVPAGPIPNTTSCEAMVWRYSSCPAVFATTGGRLAEVRILTLASELRSGVAAPRDSATDRTAYMNSCLRMATPFCRA